VGTVELRELLECSFRAMGTDVHIAVLDGSAADLHWAHDEVHRAEARLTRFRASSDVRRICTARGRPVAVHPATVLLVKAAIDAWTRTGGRFDPLLGRDMARLGYDRTFDEIERSGAGAPSPDPGSGIARRAPSDIIVDEARGRVAVPPGAALDLGGIAKGWTADSLAADLVSRGAAGACVNIGGDLAVDGAPPTDEGWHIAVDHEGARGPARHAALRAGGAATSTVLRRTWNGPAGDARCHLLDPSTRRPVDSEVTDATVVASSAAAAEVLAKVAIIDPSALHGLLEQEPRAAVLLTRRDGRTDRLGDPSPWLSS
jgi:thiamine biosynthesis lipoprotein